MPVKNTAVSTLAVSVVLLAVLAQGSIKSLECVEYPELGMEAIWKIEVEDFPAFILVDDKGNDFFQQIQLTQCTRCVK